MNIAIFINDISKTGGTEIVSISYADRLKREGNDVFFISMNYSSKNSDVSNKKYCILRDGSPKSSLNNKEINKAVKYCSSKNVQRALFIINIPYKGSPVSNLKLIKKISKICKIEVVFHNSPKSYLKRYPNFEKNIIGNILRQLKTKIVLVPQAKKFIKYLPKYNVDIYTLNHGCKNELKQCYGIDSKIRYNTYKIIDRKTKCKRNIVTFCGRIAFEKNIILLLQAWKIAKTDGWVLRLIGNGNKLEYFKKLCKELNINNIEFTGGVEHSKIYDYLAESKICCLTSFNEGFPTVIVEAMNMGNAIITTKYDGFSDELFTDENTIVTAGYSVDEYAKALNKLLENTEIVEKMGIAALEKCRSFYNSDEYLNNH